MYLINDPAVVTSPITPGHIVSLYTRPSVKVNTTSITGNGSAPIALTAPGALNSYFMFNFPCNTNIQKFDGPVKFRLSLDVTTLSNTITVGGRLSSYPFSTSPGVYDTEVVPINNGAGTYDLTKQFSSIDRISSSGNFTGSLDVYILDCPAVKKTVDADNDAFMMLPAGRYDFGFNAGIFNGITLSSTYIYQEGLVLTTTSLSEGDLVVPAADGKVRKRLSSDTCKTFGIALLDAAMNDYAYIFQLPYHLLLGA